MEDRRIGARIPTPQEVADAFRAALRRWLTPAELLAVDQANGLRADGPCATHDHCDANMAMLEAVVGLTGLSEDDVADRLVEGDALLDAVNDGWTLAKVEGFSRG